MTPTEINAAIAEIVGWKPTTDGGICWDADGNAIVTPPDYYGDLNAIHQAVMACDESVRRGINTCLALFVVDHREPRFIHLSINATAPQRCEAFLRAHGKWRGE